MAEVWGGLLVGDTVRPLRWQLALLSVYGCGGLWRHGVVAAGAWRYLWGLCVDMALTLGLSALLGIG